MGPLLVADGAQVQRGRMAAGRDRGRTAARAAFVLVMAFMALGARSESAPGSPVVAAVTIALPWPIGRFWRDRDLLLRLILPVVLVAMSRSGAGDVLWP